MKNEKYYNDLVKEKMYLKGEKGETIAILARNSLLIPWVLSINFYVLTSLNENFEKNVEKLRDFLKDNFSLYVEYEDIKKAYNKGTFSAWLFEDPNNYQDLQIIKL